MRLVKEVKLKKLAMDVQTILQELESLGTERTKKAYMQQGAHEPPYGVATGVMKPIVRKIKTNQELAEELYATGNYMYQQVIVAIAGCSVSSESMSVVSLSRTKIRNTTSKEQYREM